MTRMFINLAVFGFLVLLGDEAFARQGHVKYAGTRIGNVASDHVLHVIVSLQLNNQPALDQLLVDLYDPNSPIYGQYLTPQQFVNEFSPTSDQVSSVSSFLQGHSIEVTVVDENRILVHATGNVGSLNTAFQTQIGHYIGDDGVHFIQPDEEPTFPQGLSINAVHGLHNRTRLRHHSSIKSSDPFSEKGNLRRDLQQNSLTPAAIKTAYQIGSTFQGTGQVAALVEFDTYLASDIAAYCRNFGITQVSLENVLVSANGQSAPTKPGSGQVEVTLDIELLNAMAPGMDKLMVYIGPNTGGSTVAVYSKISNDNLASVVSTSWGLCENLLSTSELSSEASLYQKMAAQGQSLFAAAGDSGAFDNGGDTHPAVDDPASQPYVTGVGGTTLTVDAKNNYVTESVWLTSKSSKGTEGGGGGISTVHTIPNYQNGVISQASKGSTTQRNVPDVALDADPNTGYVIFVTQRSELQQLQIGGTSCAAPLWAGLTALANQARIANGLSVLGFANPTLYALGKGPLYNTVFHDIKEGTNGFYPAVTGFDDASGWGTFIGDKMIAALSATNSPVGSTTKAPVASATKAPVASSTKAPVGKAPKTKAPVGRRRKNTKSPTFSPTVPEYEYEYEYEYE